jgi:Lar family restriction alleviation protein
MQPTTNPIIPCPFCADGGHVETIKPTNSYQSESWYVACDSCGANGPIGDHSPEDAIKKWNWRALLDKRLWPRGEK